MDGHKRWKNRNLVQNLDPGQDDGLSQELEQKWVQILDSKQADGWSQHME